MDSDIKKNHLFLISIGAIPGAIFRWQIDDIFIVNIIGCFLLGLVQGLGISKRYKLLFGFGFCGSITTYSGWSFQLFKLLNQGLYVNFFLNSISSVLIGLFAVGLGYLFAKKINA